VAVGRVASRAPVAAAPAPVVAAPEPLPTIEIIRGDKRAHEVVR
jgi:hypothetical protein